MSIAACTNFGHPCMADKLRLHVDTECKFCVILQVYMQVVVVIVIVIVGGSETETQ